MQTCTHNSGLSCRNIHSLRVQRFQKRLAILNYKALLNAKPVSPTLSVAHPKPELGSPKYRTIHRIWKGYVVQHPEILIYFGTGLIMQYMCIKYLNPNLL